METSNVMPNAGFGLNGGDLAPAQDIMNADMDIDMDIDLTVDPETAELEAEAMKMDHLSSAPIPEGAVDQPPLTTEPQPEKVHVRGLDNLTTGSIKAFAMEHYPSDAYVRLEWIDDTSANIIYETADAARDALLALTDPAVIDPQSKHEVELRKAKPMTSHPDADLFVRQAVVTDLKKARAHEASRFYLMNPEHDPRERKRRHQDLGRGAGDYNRRRFDDREQRRRRNQDTFDVDMYDESGEGGGEAPRARSRRHRRDSYSDFSSGDERRGGRRRAVRGRGGDLFGDGSKSDGRLRNRSASPLRDGDGRLGFEEDPVAMQRRVRRRSQTPPSAYRARENGAMAQAAGGNEGKELFPVQAPKSALLSSSSGTATPAANSGNSNSTKELFPSKHIPGKRSRELFPNKTAHSNHRRQDALDAADISDAAFTQLRANSSLEDRITPSDGSNGRSLEDRINSGSNSKAHSRPPAEGFSVRGASRSEHGEPAPGFSIRGAAGEAPRELFPLKSGKGGSGGNAGKELFAEKIKGRGGPRRRAEDMFF
ncbi:uncharacterized protein K452DRAFT_21062 [Aplosporella prunicola CBS 121167]|uniref:Uncharacterized protein n=1 Tax=Aplosporella prunicola CBS 121167 TaxID=1176127 RepID=A0A6A6BEJ2_9PEZI|nr:uncharacterized protein K452DRAFT_21062 [Aplosporella prunicola CBS 121167]KAF2142582.1 hypothetical protein K452DRAFT_21062 [Aplosporella prunicola CBS 121167]